MAQHQSSAQCVHQQRAVPVKVCWLSSGRPKPRGIQSQDWVNIWEAVQAMALAQNWIPN